MTTPAKRGTRPPRGYSWPPFENGNTAALKHGARSAELVGRRVRELMPAILDANPHLDAVRDAAGMWRYAMALARIERVSQWLAEQDDPVFADLKVGEVHAVFGRLREWERSADLAEERLAIAPLTRARLGLDTMRAKALANEKITEFLNGEGAV